MFDPKQVTSSMLGYAPQFVLARFSSVIMGVVVAYGVLLFFLGQPPFFQRVGELGLIMPACHYAARGVRYVMTRAVAIVEGPVATAVTAAAATGTPTPSPTSASGSGTSPKGSLAQKSANSGAANRSSEKEEKGLD